MKTHKGAGHVPGPGQGPSGTEEPGPVSQGELSEGSDSQTTGEL